MKSNTLVLNPVSSAIVVFAVLSFVVELPDLLAQWRLADIPCSDVRDEDASNRLHRSTGNRRYRQRLTEMYWTLAIQAD